MEEDWTTLCGMAEVPEDGLRLVVADRVLAVWKLGANVYVTDDTCTHGEASLVRDGALEGHTIVCGLHLGEFDIRSGAVLAMPCTKPLRTYPARVENNKVLARLHG